MSKLAPLLQVPRFVAMSVSVVMTELFSRKRTGLPKSIFNFFLDKNSFSLHFGGDYCPVFLIKLTHIVAEIWFVVIFATIFPILAKTLCKHKWTGSKVFPARKRLASLKKEMVELCQEIYSRNTETDSLWRFVLLKVYVRYMYVCTYILIYFLLLSEALVLVVTFVHWKKKTFVFLENENIA